MVKLDKIKKRNKKVLTSPLRCVNIRGRTGKPARPILDNSESRNPAANLPRASLLLFITGKQ